MRRARVAALAALALLGGCVETGFELPSEVTGIRVLAMVADRPEAAPGDDVTVRALVVDPAGRALELRWSMCLGGGAVEAGGFGAGGVFGASGAEQFGGEIPDPGCPEGALFTTPLESDGDTAIVPGECADPSEPWRCTRGVVELFALLGGMEGVPSELVARVVEQVGIAITVNLDVYLDGELALRAFKRVAVTRRATLGQNPPPPRARLGDTWVTPDPDGDPFVCVPETGVRPIFAGLSEVVLAPDDDDDGWRETFPIVALDGSLQEGRENAYYSWFSTGGSFDPEISVAPRRDTTWTTPRDAGVYPVWLVVRDGHLGQSACRAEVEILDAVPPFTGIERL